MAEPEEEIEEERGRQRERAVRERKAGETGLPAALSHSRCDAEMED